MAIQNFVFDSVRIDNISLNKLETAVHDYKPSPPPPTAQVVHVVFKGRHLMDFKTL